MKSCPSCAAWIPDEARFCPSCGGGAAGGAAPPPGPGPGDAPPVGAPPEGGEPGFDRERAVRRVKGLGVLFVVAGALLLVVVALSFVSAATGSTLQSFDEVQLELEKNPRSTEESREILRKTRDLYLVPAFLALAHAVPFLLGCFWIWAGTSLQSLRGRTLGIVAAVLMIVLAPCNLPAIYTGCCCCLTIPLGVWALFVLTTAEAERVLAGR